jgi:integrase
MAPIADAPAPSSGRTRSWPRRATAPIVGLTNHSLRRTFASLLYEAGASPAYVMGQMGHTSASMALEVYSRMMSRDRDTGSRLDALVRGVCAHSMGTNQEMDEALVALSDDTMGRHPA